MNKYISHCLLKIFTVFSFVFVLASCEGVDINQDDFTAELTDVRLERNQNLTYIYAPDPENPSREVLADLYITNPENYPPEDNPAYDSDFAQSESLREWHNQNLIVRTISYIYELFAQRRDEYGIVLPFHKASDDSLRFTSQGDALIWNANLLASLCQIHNWYQMSKNQNSEDFNHILLAISELQAQGLPIRNDFLDLSDKIKSLWDSFRTHLFTNELPILPSDIEEKLKLSREEFDPAELPRESLNNALRPIRHPQQAFDFIQRPTPDAEEVSTSGSISADGLGGLFYLGAVARYSECPYLTSESNGFGDLIEKVKNYAQMKGRHMGADGGYYARVGNERAKSYQIKDTTSFDMVYWLYHKTQPNWNDNEFRIPSGQDMALDAISPERYLDMAFCRILAKDIDYTNDPILKETKENEFPYVFCTNPLISEDSPVGYHLKSQSIALTWITAMESDSPFIFDPSSSINPYKYITRKMAQTLMAQLGRITTPDENSFPDYVHSFIKKPQRNWLYWIMYQHMIGGSMHNAVKHALSLFPIDSPPTDNYLDGLGATPENEYRDGLGCTDFIWQRIPGLEGCHGTGWDEHYVGIDYLKAFAWMKMSLPEGYSDIPNCYRDKNCHNGEIY